MDWEQILIELAEMEDDEFQDTVVRAALDGLYQFQGKLLYDRLGDLQRKLEVFFQCGS